MYAKKNAAKNWDRIYLKNNGNKPLLASCNQPTDGDWVNSVRNTFEKNNLLDVYLDEAPSSIMTTYCQLFEHEKGVFIQTALESIQNLPKMRTYRLLKQSWGLEDYLLAITDIKDRIALTKLRLSNHNLSIEKGRHNNLHLSERTCPFCPEQIENELHFLISCPTYESLRTRLIDDVELLCIGFFYPQNEDFLFWLLLNNPIISESTSKYIRLSLELREFLLNQHRNNA